MSGINRREFLQGSAMGLGALTAASAALGQEAPAKAPPSERVRMGCVGVAGRAGAVMNGFAALKDVELVHICDLDAKHLAAGVESGRENTGKAPAADRDVPQPTPHPA